MPYVYLISSVFFIASSSVIGGFYNRKNTDVKGATALYNVIQIGAAFLLWTILFIVDGKADARVLLYALLMGGFFALCNIGLLNALNTGSVAFTSLTLQCSLIGVTIWGFIFWNAKVTALNIIGLVLLGVALWLCLYPGKAESEPKQKITKKWLFFALLTFLGNAGCSIVQRTQQTAFNGEYGSMLMCVAMAIALIVCVCIFLREKEKKATILATRKTWAFPVAAGACNVLLNLFVIWLAVSSISPTLVYPVISVGGLIVSTLFSVVAFKERFHWWQWIGVGVGMLSIAILSV